MTATGNSPKPSTRFRRFVIVSLSLAFLMVMHLLFSPAIEHQSGPPPYFEHSNRFKDLRVAFDKCIVANNNAYPPIPEGATSSAEVLEEFLKNSEGLDAEIIKEFPYSYFIPQDPEIAAKGPFDLRVGNPVFAYPLLKQKGVQQLKDVKFDTDKLYGYVVILYNDGLTSIARLTEDGKLTNADNTLFQQSHIPMKIYYPKDAKTAP